MYEFTFWLGIFWLAHAAIGIAKAIDVSEYFSGACGMTIIEVHFLSDS